MLDDLFATDLFPFVVVFARLGAALMTMPGFGEATVTPRLRLTLALAVTVVLVPIVGPLLPVLPAGIAPLLLLVISEVLIGVAIGTFARLLTTGLQVGGTFIAYHTGLGSAQLFDPQAQQQGAITGAFMTTMGITLLFVADLHHLMLAALADSYAVFVPGVGVPLGDVADTAARFVADGFRLGLRIAMPVVMFSLIIYASMGLMGRLMPQMQVFFVALPLQLLIGFLVFAFSLAAGLSAFLGTFEAGMIGLFGVG